MTSSMAEVNAGGRLPTEEITLNLETKALYVARVAARARGLSLSEWLSGIAWTQAIAEAAVTCAEECRRHPDEWPGWEEETLDRIFGMEAA